MCYIIVMRYLFILSYLIFFVGLTIFKKTNKKINIIRYLVLQIMLVMIFSVMLMTILFIFGIGTVPIFVSSVLGVFGIILIILTIKRKSIQKYEFRWVDFMATMFIMVVAVMVGIRLFGTGLNIAYNNADPAAHFYNAQNNLINGKHSGMYFYEVNNALIMNGLGVFTSSTFMNYKLYLIIEIGMLALSGLMFYVLIAEFAKNKKRCGICAVITVLYMLGYSLNNMIFGFGYLGVAVTLICFLMVICKKLWDGKISLKIFVPLIAMSVLSLALCYMLFAPIIWILVFIIVLGYCRKNKIGLKKTAMIELGIFAVPLILAIKFCYFDFFLATDLSISKQLQAPGGFYKNYGTNFVIFAPIALYAIVQNIRKKKSFITMMFVLGWSIFVFLGIFIKQMGLMSPYYFIKIYYVMWLMVFVVFTDGMMQMIDGNAELLGFIFVTVLALVVGAFSINMSSLMDVYEYNFNWLKSHYTISDETIAAYKYANDEIIDKGKKITWIANIYHFEKAFWFYSMQAIGTNECNYCQPWNYDKDGLKKIIKQEDVEYIGIYKFAPDSYENYKSVFEHEKIVFENTEIAIYALANKK